MSVCAKTPTHPAAQNKVVEEPNPDANDEESMLSCIKNFDVEEANRIKLFVGDQLKQPVTLQDKFFELRRAVSSSSSKKHFQEIDQLKDQLQYLHGLVQDKGIFPQSWLTYASSASYMLKKVGWFAEGTQAVFCDETVLGIFSSLRAKYVLLSLRDLIKMKCLKINQCIEGAVSDLVSKIDNMDPEKDDEISASLAAFDCEPCRAILKFISNLCYPCPMLMFDSFP